MNTTVDRDERTVSVENASYRLAFLLLSFGVLLIAAYRSYRFREPTWDLLALVVLAGGAATIYQAFQRVVARRWALISILSIVAAGTVAALLVWLR